MSHIEVMLFSSFNIISMSSVEEVVLKQATRLQDLQVGACVLPLYRHVGQ